MRKGNPVISEKSRLANFYNLARYIHSHMGMKNDQLGYLVKALGVRNVSPVEIRSYYKP